MKLHQLRRHVTTVCPSITDAAWSLIFWLRSEKCQDLAVAFVLLKLKTAWEWYFGTVWSPAPRRHFSWWLSTNSFCLTQLLHWVLQKSDFLSSLPESPHSSLKKFSSPLLPLGILYVIKYIVMHFPQYYFLPQTVPATQSFWHVQMGFGSFSYFCSSLFQAHQALFLP